jgi:hypothetical protein
MSSAITITLLLGRKPVMGYDKNKTTRPNLDKVIHAMWQMGGGNNVALFIDPPVVRSWCCSGVHRPPLTYPTPLAMLAMFCQMTSAPNTNEHNGCGCVEEATVVVLASRQRRRSKKKKANSRNSRVELSIRRDPSARAFGGGDTTHADTHTQQRDDSRILAAERTLSPPVLPKGLAVLLEERHAWSYGILRRVALD